jgi:mRNA interferase MazF
MTTFKRGDMVLAWFPHSDLRTLKRRPALVVQADQLGTGIPQVVLALITTNMVRLGHPSRVFVPRVYTTGAHSGLTADSVVMTDNLATVLEKAIDSVIGSLPDMTAIDVALRHTLGI